MLRCLGPSQLEDSLQVEVTTVFYGVLRAARRQLTSSFELEIRLQFMARAQLEKRLKEYGFESVEFRSDKDPTQLRVVGNPYLASKPPDRVWEELVERVDRSLMNNETALYQKTTYRRRIEISIPRSYRSPLIKMLRGIGWGRGTYYDDKGDAPVLWIGS